MAIPGTSPNAKAYGRNLADEEEDTKIMNKRMFEDLRKETMDETISQAGSDEDEVIPVGPSAGEALDQANVEGDEDDMEEGQRQDELANLLADTPLRKLRARSKDADKLSKAGDKWGALRLRQEVLALARMYFGPYRGGERGRHPMLLSSAHFKLAKAYADLGCFPQTAEHCSRAMEALPAHGHQHEKVGIFKRDVNILLGEMLLLSKPPKPQIALQHFNAASDASGAANGDLAVKVLVAQCRSLLGNAKMEEAKSVKDARVQLESRIAALQERLDALNPKSTERAGLQQKIENLNAELAEESDAEAGLLAESYAELEGGIDSLMEVIDEEEGRLRKVFEGDKYKQHPLLAALFRRLCEMQLKLATIEGMRGNTSAEIRLIGEIKSAQASYNFLPLGLLSRALKELGAVHVVLKNYDEALKVYAELLVLQQDRYPDDPAKLGVAQAEVLKLIGNVHVAKKRYRRALEHYDKALQLFSKFLGSNNGVVLDLEHRINEIRSSYMDEA